MKGHNNNMNAKQKHPTQRISNPLTLPVTRTPNHGPAQEAAHFADRRAPRSRHHTLIGSAVLALALVAASSMAFARPGGGPCPQGGPGGGPGAGAMGGLGGLGGMGGPGLRLFRLIRDLDLTEEQEVALVKLRRSLQDERSAMRATAEDDTKILAAELAKATPNANEIDRLIEKRAQAHTQMAKKAVEKFLVFHQTLTPAQRKMLSEAAAKLPERFNQNGDGRRGWRKGGRGGGR
ncbi:MAG: Spy/CpxP family protein refolding chaperone [Deltaproteobacteria bacterium]|nr:Spy/CpxP family protein refolding chaperone [Deltaproteobacteria bacterium]